MDDTSQTSDDNLTALAPHLLNAMVDSEILQSFSSPAHMQYLAARNTLDSPDSLARLTDIYTRYTTNPALLAHLKYPRALHYLHLTLTSARFRAHLRTPGFVAYLEKVQGLPFPVPQ